MQMTEEMQKRIEEAAYSYDIPRHFNCYGCCQSDSDYEKAFKAGANFILEMPELREAVVVVKSYIRHGSDCYEGFVCIPCDVLCAVKKAGSCE